MPRRTKGEGSIRLRPDGRYECRFLVGTLSGRQYKSTYGKTAKLARAKRDELIEQMAKINPSNISFVDYLYELVDTPRLAKESKRNYEGSIRNYIEPVVADLKLTDVKNLHIKSIYKRMEDKGLSLRTQTGARIVMSRAFRAAVLEDYIAVNPMDKVANHPNPPKAKPNPLEMPEQELLLATETKPEYKNLWTIAMDTGMRKGELFGLKWSDIDYDGKARKNGKKVSAPVIKVLRQYNERHKEFKEPKHGSVREVTLLPTVVQALENQRRVLIEKQLKSHLWVDNDLVFTNTLGEPKKGNRTGEYLTKRLKQLGIKHRRFHDFRATFGTNCMRQNVNIHTTKKWMGHKDIKTTLEIYATATPEMEVDDSEKMRTLGRKVS